MSPALSLALRFCTALLVQSLSGVLNQHDQQPHRLSSEYFSLLRLASLLRLPQPNEPLAVLLGHSFGSHRRNHPGFPHEIAPGPRTASLSTIFSPRLANARVCVPPSGRLV